MKRISIILMLLISAFTFGQELDLGIKAGVNFSNISDAQGLNNKTGFQAGVFAGIKFNDNFGVQADILYSQQGAEFDAGKFDLTYVNVPIVLKIYVIKGLNLQAGPQFGFLVKDEVRFDLIDFAGELDNDTTDISAIAGAGYDLPFGLRVDARYNFGLKDVNNKVEGKNQVISLAVGYSFL